MKGIEVVRINELKKGDAIQGIKREKAFEGEDVLVARSRVAGGVTSDWHHHGARNLYGFLVSGRPRLESDEGGMDAVEINSGDFFHIPVGLVHRDINPDERQEAVVLNILLGKGSTVVSVSST